MFTNRSFPRTAIVFAVWLRPVASWLTTVSGAAAGRSPAARKRIANHRVIGSKEQLGAAQRDARASVVAKALAHIRPSIAGVVAQRDDASPRVARVPNRDEHIAVRSHRNVAHRAQAVSDDQRAKTLWQRDATVVAIAGRTRRLLLHAAHRRGAADHEGRYRNDDSSHGIRAPVKGIQQKAVRCENTGSRIRRTVEPLIQVQRFDG